MHPADSYEFVDLLTQTEMASLERNRMLEELANRIRRDPQLAQQIESGDHSKLDQDFLADLETFIQKFGDLSCSVTGGTQCVQDAQPLFKILREMANLPTSPPNKRKSNTTDNLKEKFLSHFDGVQQTQAAELLDLARASYQIRDDDNIYLGRIEAQLLAAIQEARRRRDKQSQAGGAAPVSEELKKVLDDFLATRDYCYSDPRDLSVHNNVRFSGKQSKRIMRRYVIPAFRALKNCIRKQ